MAYTLDFTKIPVYNSVDLSNYSSIGTYVFDGLTLGNIASYMYDKDHDFFKYLDTLFSNKDSADLLRCIRMFPFDISDYFTLNTAQTTSIKWGGSYANVVTNGRPVYEPLMNGQYSNIFLIADFNIPYFENIDSFLSYEPYSNMMLHLPFCNDLMPIDFKRVKNNKLWVHGAINLYDGDLLYIVTTDGSEYINSCKVHITSDVEIFSQDIKSYLKGMINSLAGIANSTIKPKKSKKGFDTTNLYTAAVTGLRPSHAAPRVMATGIFNMATQPLETYNVIQGNNDVMGAYYSPLTPALLIYKPKVKYSLSDTSYNHLYGVPCRKIDTLSNFGGFTKVGNIHIKEIAGATTSEVDEIENLLRDGVIMDNTSAVLSITYRGSNITYSYNATMCNYGESYVTTYTLDTGYQLDSIVVTMGGIDITSTAVSGNRISISEVTGNVVITAVTSALPVTYTITYTGLTGATLSNQSVTITSGSSYTNTLTPQYSNNYYMGSFEPIVQMDGVILSGVYNNGVIYIADVEGDLVISGTLPQVSTMTDNWIYDGQGLTLPDDAIIFSGTNVTCNFDDGSTQYTGDDIVIDNEVDGDGYFITFTYGGTDSVGIDPSGRIYVNGSYVSTLHSIDFSGNSQLYSQFNGLLKWLDTNFTKDI